MDEEMQEPDGRFMGAMSKKWMMIRASGRQEVMKMVMEFPGWCRQLGSAWGLDGRGTYSPG